MTPSEFFSSPIILESSYDYIIFIGLVLMGAYLGYKITTLVIKIIEWWFNPR